MAKNLGVLDFHLSIVTPLPGTPLWDQCVKEDLFLDGRTINDINFGQAGIKLPDTSPEELEYIRRSVWQEAFQKRRLINEQAVTLKKFGITKKAIEYLQPLIKGEAEISFKDGMPKVETLKLIEVNKKLRNWA